MKYQFEDGRDIQDDRLALALANIKTVWGEECVLKGTYLREFGRNLSLSSNVPEMVCLTGGLFENPTGNTIDEIVATDAGDTLVIYLEGHTVDGSGNLTPVIQLAALNGLTPVSLATPLKSIERGFVTGTTDLIDDVLVSDSGSTITHLTISADSGRSLKAASAIGDDDYWILSSALFTVHRSQSTAVDFEIQFKLHDSVWFLAFSCDVSSSVGSFHKQFDPPLTFPSNSEIRVIATSSANNVEVDSQLNGYLAKTKDL